MERLRADVAAICSAPAFADLRSAEFLEADHEIVFRYKLPAPHDEARVRLSKEYCTAYPNGSVSMMLAGRFHVVPVTAQVTVAGLARHIYDLMIADMGGGDGMGVPHGTLTSDVGGGMEGTSSGSWSLEPTLEYGDGERFHGVNGDLLGDLDGASAVRAVLHDMPAIGRAAIVCEAKVNDLLRKTDCDAYSLDHAAPMLVQFTVDRAQYKAAPMTVQVGQVGHFRANAFPPLCQQLSRILTNASATLTAGQHDQAATDPLSVLVSVLGYDEGHARTALERNDNDIEAACAYLSDVTEEEMKADTAAAGKLTGAASRSAASSAFSPVATKRLPPATQNVFVSLTGYLRQRVTTLSAFCVICDRTHVFAGSSMMMPTVCSRELCVFRFQKLDVARDAASSIAVQTGVVDLLVNIARAAAKSNRWERIFNPFPSIAGRGAPSIDLARQILTSMPSVEAISGADSLVEVRRRMDAAHSDANAMFEWIVSSNKSFLVKLPVADHLTWMGSHHQFLLITSNSQRDAAFREAKAKYGSKWAFHGSRAENWHSILRNGLKNASGTNLQVNGTAYGHGIYLSPNASTSFSYSNMSCSSNDAQRSKHASSDYIDLASMLCIAICEVITHELRESGSVWVQPHEHFVQTRFFLVYTHGFTQGAQVDLNQANFKKDLNEITARHLG